MENYSLSDIASVTNGGEFGGNMGFFWIFALLLLANGGFGFGNRTGEFGQFATSASQSEILLGQRFDALGQKVNSIGDGICSSTYALNNSIMGEGRAMQTQLSNSSYEIAQQINSVNANTTAQTQKILDALAQNKIDSLQAQVSELKTQNMFCGIPRISNYAYGVYPYATSCCCGNNTF